MPTASDILSLCDDVEAPPFYRLNSEVVEKPSHLVDDDQDNFVSSSSPSPSPFGLSNLHSSHVNAGETWWLPNWSQNEGKDLACSHGDELLALSLCLAGGISDSELEGQGDEDEGFDEEFEERDLNESDNSTSHQNQHLPMEDLDPKEVQQLLGEDFDLGVDVLDSEPVPRPLLTPVTLAGSPMVNSPMVNSPMVNSPVSPEMASSPQNLACSPVSYSSAADGSFSASPSPCLDANTQRNLWNLTENMYMSTGPLSGTTRDSYPATTSPLSAITEETSVVSEGQQTLVGTRDYSEDQLACLVSAFGPDRSQTNYDQGPLMDLSETIALASANPLMASEPTHMDLQTMLQFVNGAGHLSFSSSDVPLAPESVATISQPVMDSSNIFSNLTFSNFSTNTPTHRHPPPAASPVSMTSTSLTSSPPPSPARSLDQEYFTAEEQNIIDIPWYEFRKILDDPSVSEAKKEDMKNIRRKGKNKAAAKVCRQKKMRNIRGLEQEIQELRKTKQQMAFRSRSLEREIAQWKKRCQQAR